MDPDDWERNLHRVLDEMPRTINPASAHILADLLADRAPAERARALTADHDKPTRAG